MRIVHYINQFFGQIGGEEVADYPLEVREGCVGPGVGLQKALGDSAQIVATIICGDTYFVEHKEAAEKIKDILREKRADLFVAGPAFLAGRYGVACGEACKSAYEIGIEAVCSMNEDNPGVLMYRRYAYILPCGDSARYMTSTIKNMSEFIMRIARNEMIDEPKKDGYIQRGIRKVFMSDKTGAERAVDMLLDKMSGKSYKTELPMPIFEKIEPSPAIKDIKSATIALITTGGLVPKGNPDRLEASAAMKYVVHRLEEYGGAELPNAETVHGGYDPIYVNEDGKRVLPADVLKDMEDRGDIGHLYNKVFVTTGTAMPTVRAKEFGKAIAEELMAEKVDGVILTST